MELTAPQSTPTISSVSREMPPEWKDLKRDTHTFIYMSSCSLRHQNIFCSGLPHSTASLSLRFSSPHTAASATTPTLPKHTHFFCTVISEGWELLKREEHHRASSASQLCVNFNVWTLSCFQKYWRAQCSSFPSLFIPRNLIPIYQWAHTDFRASVRPKISSAKTAVKTDIPSLFLPRFPTLPSPHFGTLCLAFYFSSPLPRHWWDIMLRVRHYRVFKMSDKFVCKQYFSYVS